MKYSILQNVLTSSMESELGALFRNTQEGVCIRNILIKMGHSQPPTIIITDTQAKKSVANETAKQKRSKEIIMKIHWIRDRTRRVEVYIKWKRGGNSLTDYFTRHYSTWVHQRRRKIYLD